VHRHAERDGFDLGDARVHVVAEIRLREQDDRLRAALPAQRQVALDATDVEVVVEPRDDEYDVHVRREHLRLRLVERRLPDERTPPRQDGVDCRPAFVGARSDGEPVANCGMLAFMPELPGCLRAKLTELGVDDVVDSVFHGRARGNEAVLLVRPERFGERLVPAEGLQIQDVSSRELVSGTNGRAVSARTGRRQ
jgi:hypothetical protein